MRPGSPCERNCLLSGGIPGRIRAAIDVMACLEIPALAGQPFRRHPKRYRLFVTASELCAEIHMEAGMAIGTVKWFNPSKGFGFIQPENGSKDVFVHISAVERAGMSKLDEGQRVSYDIITERGREAAGNLKPA